MKSPFCRAVVNTIKDTCNQFYVFVNDVEQMLENRKQDRLPTDAEAYKLALERALFIQQAIEEKLEREAKKRDEL